MFQIRRLAFMELNSMFHMCFFGRVASASHFAFFSKHVSNVTTDVHRAENNAQRVFLMPGALNIEDSN